MECLQLNNIYTITEFITSIVQIAFDNGLVLFGGAIRSFILNEFPNDLDFTFTDYKSRESFLKCLVDANYWVAKIEGKYNKMCSSYSVIDLNNHENGITIDLVFRNSFGKDPDFDVNSLIMKSFDEINVANGIDLSIQEILENILKRKFNIIKSKKEFTSRTDNLVNNSLYLIRFIKMQSRIAKMLSRGWECPKEDIKQHFYPLLIKENKNKESNCSMCSFCKKKLNANYILQLYCCGYSTCDDCFLEYIKANFENSEIYCPFCLEDPTGLQTVQPIEI